MISDIAKYYISSDSPSKNEIISSNINIIKDLINEINRESDSKFEHSLFNKQGSFLTSISTLDLTQSVTDYQNGKTNTQIEKYSNVNYNTDSITIDNTNLLTQLIDFTFNEAAGKIGLEAYSKKAAIYTINLKSFNLNLSFTTEVGCYIFSPPTPWGEPYLAPQVSFDIIRPSLFDINLI